MDGAPDEPPIALHSPRELALFLLPQRQLADPEIGHSPDGLVLAEWTSPRRDASGMELLPDGAGPFAAVSAAGGCGTTLQVQGRVPKDHVLDAVRAFTAALDGPYAPHSAGCSREKN